MTETQHTKACWAMPECTVCGLRKKPIGRDAGVMAASGYCGEDCPGYRQEPLAGHLWQGETEETCPDCYEIGIIRDAESPRLVSLCESHRGNDTYKQLDCAMCGAPNSFVISPLDPAVGYCFKEQKAWRINSLTCATVGCLRAKAAFGDYCMECLNDRVNAE